MSNAQPTATGTFSKTPLLHVLMSLLESASTGTLVIETAQSSRSALQLERGVPTKMRLGEPQARLGEVLVDLGYLKRDVVASTFETATEQGKLHGRILLEAGLLDEDTLALALRTQLAKKLQVAAAFPGDTVFGFYDGADYLSKWRSGSVPLSPLVAAWVLARSRADATVVATMTHRIASHPLRLHRQAQPKAFGFDRAELALIDVMRARPQSLEALNRMGLIASHTLERMVYVLTLTHHLDFGRNLSPLGIGAVGEREEGLLLPKETLRPSRPVVLSSQLNTTEVRVQEVPAATPGPQGHETAPITTALEHLDQLTPAADKPNNLKDRSPFEPTVTTTQNRAASTHPSPTPPLKASATTEAAHKERRAQIEKMAQAAADQDHFEILGVAKDAPSHVTQEAFLKLAKLYHPDRLPEELADLRPLATKIFARISDAHQTLSDPTKRQAYVEGRKRTGTEDEDEKVRRILRAAGSFQKAEVLFKKRMLAAAELEINRALEDDPDQPDYRALFAWIQSCKADSEPRLAELLKMVADAVTRNPASEKNRFYRVQILKRLGRIDEAVADCRIIVEKNPHHVDALREIRLWEMRRSPQKHGTGTKTAPGSKLSSTSSRSDPPSHAPPAGRRGEPPPTGGLLGRLFKR